MTLAWMFASSTGGPGPFLFAGNIGARTAVAAAWPDGTPPFRMSGHNLNAPTLDLSHSGPFLALRKSPESRAHQPVTRASTGRRSGHSGTLSGSVRRDWKLPGTERSKTRTTPSRPSRI